MSQDINILALAKGEERYLFLFTDETRAETLRMLGRHASNPELSFTWYDAAVISQKIRATCESKSTASSSSVLPQAITTPLTPRFQLPPVSDMSAGGTPE